MKKKTIIIFFIIVLLIICGILLMMLYNEFKKESKLGETNKNINNIVKLEISLFDEDSQDGIAYKDPILIENKEKIEEIVNIINCSTIFPDEEFDAEYGAGGFFEGSDELVMYDNNGKKYCLMAIDNFDNSKSEPVNIFFITESEDYSEKILYKTNYKLGNKIKELAGKNVDSENLRLFLQYIAFLNEKKDMNYEGVEISGIKLDIASYYINSYTYTEEGLVSYNKSDIDKSMKEIFSEYVDLNTVSAFGLKYDKKTDSFCYEAGGDGVCSTYLVKIESEEVIDDIYNITFIYSYPDEADFSNGELPECDCFKTNVKLKINENYFYSKYKLLNLEEMNSTYVGKIKDIVNIDLNNSNIGSEKTMKLYLKINNKTLTASLENNSSVDSLIEKLKSGDITINMKDYANFEKVGKLNFELPRNDKQITTEPGDIILYQGNSITIYYDTNNWNFTKLGKIDNITKEELKDVLGTGNVEVTFSINN